MFDLVRSPCRLSLSLSKDRWLWFSNHSQQSVLPPTFLPTSPLLLLTLTFQTINYDLDRFSVHKHNTLPLHTPPYVFTIQFCWFFTIIWKKNARRRSSRKVEFRLQQSAHLRPERRRQSAGRSGSSRRSGISIHQNLIHSSPVKQQGEFGFKLSLWF